MEGKPHLKRLRLMLQMIRFSHTVFALPFALLAAVMAWSVPIPEIVHADVSGPLPRVGFSWSDLTGILLCMVFARSAAMAFNRIVDRRFDAENPRTSNRHLVVGSLSLTSVVLFAIVTSLGFVLATLLFLPNWLPLALSVPVLVFLFAYSFAKRFTMFAHFWLGTALMLAPVCAWIAVRGEIVLLWPIDLLPATIVAVAVLSWVAGFDIIYACQDFDSDRRAELHSVPVALGIPRALRLAAVSHVVMLAMLVWLPWACPRLGLGFIYGLGVFGVAALLLYEHAVVRPSDLSRVNLAFFRVNAVVSIGLFAVVTIDLLT